MASEVPSQPPHDQAYRTAGNPVDQKPFEAKRAADNAHADAVPIASRTPNDTTTAEPTPTSRARGIHGAPPGEETHGYTQDQLDSAALDADQMGGPGEGKFADAVERKPGASGAQPGLESGLERKKAEQEEARRRAHERDGVVEGSEGKVDVQKVLGGRN